MMRASIAAIILIIAAFPACAQDFFAGNIQSGFNTGSVASLNITRGDVLADEPQGQPRGDPDYRTVPSPAVAAFRPTRDVADRVNDRFVDMMSRGQVGKRGEMAAFLGNGALMRNFERLMASYGFDPLNLADVVAAHYIVLWEVVHDQVPTQGEIRGTRGRIVAALAGKSELAGMSNAQKQEAADTLKLLSALALTSYEDFKRRGDRQGLASFQTIVSGWTRRQGIDLGRLSITESGFRER